MLQAILNLLEHNPFIFVVLLIFFVPIATVTLGALMIYLGLFHPGRTDTRTNRASIKLLGAEIGISGTIRFAAVVAGIIIIILALK